MTAIRPIGPCCFAPLMLALMLPVEASAQVVYEAIIGTATGGNQILW